VTRGESSIADSVGVVILRTQGGVSRLAKASARI
jgi:hypothetical protein